MPNIYMPNWGRYVGSITISYHMGRGQERIGSMVKRWFSGSGGLELLKTAQSRG